MANYTEEEKRFVTLDDEGNKSVCTITITLKDGVQIGESRHRTTILPGEDVPQDIADLSRLRRASNLRNKFTNLQFKYIFKGGHNGFYREKAT